MVLFWQQHLPARVLAVGILGAFALSTLTLPVARAQLACTQQNSLFFYQQGKSASFQSKIIAIFLIKECCTGGLARTGTASIRIWRHFIPPPPPPPHRYVRSWASPTPLTVGTSTYMLSVGGYTGLVAGPTLAGGVARHLPLRVTLALPWPK